VCAGGGGAATTRNPLLLTPTHITRSIKMATMSGEMCCRFRLVSLVLCLLLPSPLLPLLLPLLAELRELSRPGNTDQGPCMCCSDAGQWEKRACKVASWDFVASLCPGTVAVLGWYREPAPVMGIVVSSSCLHGHASDGKPPQHTAQTHVVALGLSAAHVHRERERAWHKARSPCHNLPCALGGGASAPHAFPTEAFTFVPASHLPRAPRLPPRL
jgi:hypothetical protein